MPKARTYQFWTREELGRMLWRQAEHYELPEEALTLIKEAVRSELWNPLEDFDGCTVVQDLHHPFIPCFVHDYLWHTGQGGKRSDVIFRKLLDRCGKTKAGSWLFFIGVRIGWLAYYENKHRRAGNIRPESESMIKLFYAL